MISHAQYKTSYRTNFSREGRSWVHYSEETCYFHDLKAQLATAQTDLLSISVYWVFPQHSDELSGLHRHPYAPESRDGGN